MKNKSAEEKLEQILNRRKPNWLLQSGKRGEKIESMGAIIFKAFPPLENSEKSEFNLSSNQSLWLDANDQ